MLSQQSHMALTRLCMDKLSPSAFVDLWERLDWWELVKKKGQYYSKKGTKIRCGKVNYNWLIIVRLLKWSFSRSQVNIVQ